eukprot:751654-Hanusia_phi.AAC.8
MVKEKAGGGEEKKTRGREEDTQRGAVEAGRVGAVWRWGTGGKSPRRGGWAVGNKSMGGR